MKPVILYPPTIDWDYLHQRPQQLCKALSQLGCTCVFCNPDIHNRYTEHFKRLSNNLLLANQLSWESVVAWTRKSYPQSPLIAYYTYPPQSVQLRRSKVDLLWFDSVDEPVGEFTSWHACYAAAVSSAHLVTATAHSLCERAKQHARSEVFLLPNGCDYEHFKQAQAPLFGTIPFPADKPVIGYIGAIAPWLDWSLIHTMVHFLPQYEFVLIGPLLLQSGVSVTGSNMHYLGHKNYETLPQYLSRFDYCLIPFKLTEMTQGVNPVKFWEYLASGKPILSTPLPEIPPEFVTPVTEDLFPGFTPPTDTPGEREARISAAQQNAWPERAKKILGLLEQRLHSG